MEQAPKEATVVFAAQSFKHAVLVSPSKDIHANAM
jgi:hypothetical protein